MHGLVTQVSADLKQVDAQTPPYYSVRMKVTKDELPKLVDLGLKPGMPVEVFIQTKPLSRMAYLMQPLTDQLNRTIWERHPSCQGANEPIRNRRKRLGFMRVWSKPRLSAFSVETLTRGGTASCVDGANATQKPNPQTGLCG